MVTIFSNSSAELVSGLDLDQSGAFRLVFGLNQKAQPWTKPKSEVTQCDFCASIYRTRRCFLLFFVTCPRSFRTICHVNLFVNNNNNNNNNNNLHSIIPAKQCSRYLPLWHHSVSGDTTYNCAVILFVLYTIIDLFNMLGLGSGLGIWLKIWQYMG